MPTQRGQKKSTSDAYRELFQRSADAILIIEGETFIDCNDAAVDMLRCQSREEVLQTHPSELSPPVQPDGRDSYEKASDMIAIAFARGSHRFEWLHRRADGEVFPVEVLLTAVQEPDRRVLHVVWRDITERRRLEEQLRHAQKMEAVGKLAGGIAHDFNNLLVAILGNAELVALDLDGEERQLDRVQQIIEAGTRAADLVKQLLAFGRKQALIPRVLDLSELVDELRKLMERVIGEDIELVALQSSDDLRVRADRTQLEQVLLNLASNARDAMPGGGVLTIATRRAHIETSDAGLDEGLPSGDYALISVADTGTGMDERTVQRAFDPFFTTKALGQGTGLGLATVHGIIRQSGGAVQINSAPNHGTTVKILLPLTEEPLSETRRPVRPPPVGGHEVILVVEDEPAVSDLVVEALQGRGYVALSASNGQEALDIYQRRDDIDLVLSDVIMPGVGGPELIAELRRRGHRPRVLFMSGYTDDALVHLTADEDVVLLEKPFKIDDLLRRVRSALNRDLGLQL